MARKSLGYVELEWTCPNCNTRNPGPRKNCVNCGAPQPENVRFERAANEQVIADERSVRAAQAGADYICPYCGTRNTAETKVCVQCGGDLVAARRRASGEELRTNIAEQQIACTNCGTVNPASNSNCLKCGSPLPHARPAGRLPPVQPVAPGQSRKRKWLLLGGVGAGILACFAAILFLFVLPTAEVHATVSDVRWQTSVPVQELHAVSHSDQAGSPPSDAYNVSCHAESKQACEEKVVDQGNGYGEKVQDCHDESQDYCSYTEDEWQTVQTYTLDGHDYSPTYSEPTVTSNQRLGDQSVVYTVTFETEKGFKRYAPRDLKEFEQFTLGGAWTLKLNALGGVLSAGR